MTGPSLPAAGSISPPTRGISAAADYIPHIDGLRAIAVLSVIAYHLRAHWLPGGFAGVDVFFVISGFVVSASVSRWKRDGLSAFLGYFYVRRLLRIAPALVVCLLLTAFASMLVVPFAWLSLASEMTGLYAFLGLSNLYLAFQRESYFSPAAEFNPYTHTWSLGVEEQFYLLFPLLFFAWTRGGRWRHGSILLFAVVLAGSFADAFLRQRSDPSAAFYLTTSRLWELAAGVLLYQMMAASKRSFNAVHRHAREAFGWLALIGIGAAMAIPATYTFPNALPVVAATLGMLWALHGADARSSLARVLGSAAFVHIGKRSYSLYLWHWPVFVLARWTSGLESPANLIAASVVTWILAELSFRLVESPLRHSRRLRSAPPLRVILGGVLIIVGCGWLSHQFKALGPQLSLNSVTRHTADWHPVETDTLATMPGCRLQVTRGIDAAGGHFQYARAGCEERQPSQQQIFALGDSHALAYATLLTEHVLRTGSHVFLYRNPGCSFANLQPGRNSDACRAQGEAALADIRDRAKAGDVLFLVALRLDRLSDQWGGAGRRIDEMTIDNATARNAEEAHVVAQLQPLAALGMRIVFEAPKPVFAAPAFRCVDWFNAKNPACAGGLSESRAAVERYRQPAMDSLGRVAAQIHGANIWDPLLLLCTSTRCTALRDGRPLFFDGDHLSAHANRVLYDSFAPFVAGLAETQAQAVPP